MARLTLMAIAAALIGWALVQMFSVPRNMAELEVRVENANLSLRGEEFVVQVFDAASGMLAGEGGGSNATVLALAPGEYDLHVTVPGVWPHQVSTRQGLAVPGGRRTRADFDFSYGELELEVQLQQQSDARPDNAAVVKVQVFSEPRGDVPEIGFVAGEAVKLAAGRYDLRVVRTVETREKQVRWLEGIDIEPGRRRHVVVAFERGWLRVDATNAGKGIPTVDGTVTVFAAGDDSQRILETGALNVPISLATGTYDLRVTYNASNDRPVREARSIAIVDGEIHSVPIEFNSGQLIVHARTGTGERLAEYEAYTYLYRRADHRSAIAYVRAGRPMRISAGRYDVRVNLFRSADRPDVWLRDIAVVANETVEFETTFEVGDIVVRVIGKNGREQTGDEYAITIHPLGDRDRAIHRMQIGKRTRLSAGPVELQVENTYTGTSEWLEADILPGETTEVVVEAP